MNVRMAVNTVQKQTTVLTAGREQVHLPGSVTPPDPTAPSVATASKQMAFLTIVQQ